jgi:CheY-like chemotaxis protein
VRQTAEDYRSNLEATGLSLDIEAPGAPLWVDGDPVRLTQMVGNLFNNAGRFTDRGGRVQVRITRSGPWVEVTVADTGVGIEPTLLSRLFDPFSQAEQDLARTKGGLGLGLALTKGLVELHGGEITAESPGPGRGSTFRLRLPASGDPAEQKVADARPAERTLRILVVEDNHDAAEMLGELLELAGHEVKLAFDAVAALHLAREFRPEVVVSDLGLPGELDGYGLARALRSEEGLRDAYLIALSGYASEEARQRSSAAGFDAHLAKPPDLSKLEATLAAASPPRQTL